MFVHLFSHFVVTEPNEFSSKLLRQGLAKCLLKSLDKFASRKLMIALWTRFFFCLAFLENTKIENVFGIFAESTFSSE